MKFKEIWFTDLLGSLKIKYVREVAPTWLDGSSAKLGIPINESDLLVKPEKLLGEIDKPIYVGDLYKDLKNPLEQDPRGFAKKIDEMLKEKELKAKIGFELEFYLLRDNNPVDNLTYFDPIPEELEPLFDDVIKILEGSGVKVISYHHEAGHGQFEINLEAFNSLTEAADYAQFLKEVIRRVAERYGLRAVFSPKPFENLPGNGFHVHISLWKGGKNLLFDYSELSKTGKYFVGGILRYAKDLCLLGAQTEESYLRLGKSEAPKNIGFGRANRSALIRIPGRGGSIEVRFPDPTSNPYLLFPMLLLAGLEGIERKIEFEEIEGNLYEIEGLDSLPSSIEEAIKTFEESEFIARHMPLAVAYASLIKARYKEEHGD